MRPSTCPDWYNLVGVCRWHTIVFGITCYNMNAWNLWDALWKRQVWYPEKYVNAIEVVENFWDTVEEAHDWASDSEKYRLQTLISNWNGTNTEQCCEEEISNRIRTPYKWATEQSRTRWSLVVLWLAVECSECLPPKGREDSKAPTAALACLHALLHCTQLSSNTKSTLAFAISTDAATPRVSKKTRETTCEPEFH